MSKVSKMVMTVDNFEVRRWRDELAGVDLVEIRFNTGTEQRAVLLPCSFISSPAKVAAALRDQGCTLPSNKNEAAALATSLFQQAPATVGRIASRSGWHGDAFLLGNIPIGCSANDLRLAEPLAKLVPELGKSEGTLETWKEEVAKWAECSTLISFTIIVAFSAALARLIGVDEGVIFNLFGETSTGKTTALVAAQSVSGGVDELGDWNLTARAQFERAAALSDLPCIFDDVERFRAGEGGRVASLSSVVHTLTSGNSTIYAESVQRALPALNWWLWALSTSPHSLQEEFDEFNKTASGGDRVRWIDVPVPRAADKGVWIRAKPYISRAQLAKLSERLKRCAKHNHGTAIIAWLHHLAADKDEVVTRARKAVEAFVEAVCPGASDAKRRVARKFGVVYAAGIEAVSVGILPWTDRHVLRVSRETFESVWAVRVSREERLAKARRQLLELVTASDFLIAERARSPGVANEKELTGFVDLDRDSTYLRREYLEKLCGNVLAELLQSFCHAGILASGHGGKATVQVAVTIAGKIARLRFYEFRHSRLIEALGNR